MRKSHESTCVVVQSIPGNDVCISASLSPRSSCACLRTKEETDQRSRIKASSAKKKIIPLTEFGISHTFPCPSLPTPKTSGLLPQLSLCTAEGNFGLRETHTISPSTKTFIILSSLINQRQHVLCLSFITVGLSCRNG